ncbi:30S ribosomal protein S8, partial [Candidatus Kuenenbacteria bacterium RIFCSPHIGHO2_02_FULL_39_13]
MTDPIADMLTRIRNAQMVKKSVVIIPFSKLKYNILTLMASEGWVKTVKRLEPSDAAVNKSKKIDLEKLNR